MMEWVHLSAYFLGGLLLTSGVPHIVSGVTGRPFQSPFASPSGKGLASSTVNVLWGLLNFALAYLLICRVGHFELRSTAHAAAVGLGMVVAGTGSARWFGRFHGGNAPTGPRDPS